MSSARTSVSTSSHSSSAPTAVPSAVEPAAKKQKSSPPDSATHSALSSSSASSSLFSPRIPTPQFHADPHRSPPVFDSDLSSTPIHLHSHASHPDGPLASDLFSPALSSVASSGQHSTSDHLSSRVEHMFHDEAKQTQQQPAEHKSQAHKTKDADTNMSNSAHSSKSNSRAHSPAGDQTDGAGKEDPQPMQSTSSSSAAAAPQAKPNNTAKSTDPAGQTISEAELEGRFKVIRYLGKGSYGTVFVAEELATGKQVAIKKIPKCFDNLTNAKRLLREIKILRMLSHHNVIGYRGLLAPSIPATFNSLLIVFEFVDTDLAKLLASDQPITNQHVQVSFVHASDGELRDVTCPCAEVSPCPLVLCSLVCV